MASWDTNTRTVRWGLRLRTKKSKNCGSRKTTLAMVFKLMQSAEKKWRKLKGFNLFQFVINHVKFKDGVQVTEQSNKDAA